MQSSKLPHDNVTLNVPFLSLEYSIFLFFSLMCLGFTFGVLHDIHCVFISFKPVKEAPKRMVSVGPPALKTAWRSARRQRRDSKKGRPLVTYPTERCQLFGSPIVTPWAIPSLTKLHGSLCAVLGEHGRKKVPRWF